MMKFTCTTCNSNNTHHIPIASCNNFLHCMKKIVKETEKIDEKRKRIRDNCKEDFLPPCVRYVSTNVKFPLRPAMLDFCPNRRNSRASMTQLHVYVTLQHSYRCFIPRQRYLRKFFLPLTSMHAIACGFFFSPRKSTSTYLPVLLHLLIISLILIPLNF